ncbi:MAG: CBS domain-containing protein [Rhodospirillum sp.]|nr:CBS domain-containing protein [Rhodospirillum sp.]MCF8490699.1 CBS domain-containing protein [Rhodospirillum sp.]MCF8499402.1 CBS domain-containing protein [Rhodospirillum sp.]
MNRAYIPVRAVMTARPLMIDGLATVAQAVAIMREKHVSSLVINRRDETDEYGVLVVTDLAKRLIILDKSPDRTNVYEIMSKPVLTVEADMDIRYAIRMLTRFDLSRSLVLDRGELVGLVTQRELVLAYLDPAAEA